MNIEEIKQHLKIILSNERYIHTLGVCEVAEKLAKLYNIDEQKAIIAALLHDCAKEYTKEEINEFCNANNINIYYLEDYPKVIHSHLGYYVAKIKYKVEDEEILNAIKYHTTGKEGMTKLEEIIYIADYLDPNRDYSKYEEEYNEANRLSKVNLEETIQYILEKTIKHLANKAIYKDTLLAYKSYSK